MASPRPLPNYLKMYRKRSGLTQRELAYLLGCQYGSKVSRYERGERLPSLSTLLAYEAIFGAPISELFEGAYEWTAGHVQARASWMLEKLKDKPRTAVSVQKHEALLKVAYPDMPSEAA